MTPAQCRAARSLLNWKQMDLSKAAGLASYMPLSYFERYGDVEYETPTGLKRRVSQRALDKLRAAFERAGIEFIGDTGVNLRKDSK